MNETKIMILASTVLLILGYAAMWYFGIFEGLGFHGTVAAILGVTLTTAIGVGLMSLLFYSNRSWHDQSAHDLWVQSGPAHATKGKGDGTDKP